MSVHISMQYYMYVHVEDAHSLTHFHTALAQELATTRVSCYLGWALNRILQKLVVVDECALAASRVVSTHMY